MQIRRSPRLQPSTIGALLLVLFATAPRSITAQIPHLSGSVALDPGEGMIDGSVCLTHFTPRRTVRFLLADPLNIKLVTDTAGEPIPYDGEYGGRIVGEARQYVVSHPDSLPPIGAFCVQYRGAVPPFDTANAYDDWKGRITAIHGNLRAAEQTRWYPTLFDSVTTVAEDRVSYDLNIRCHGCRAIYVNGSAPAQDSIGHFISDIPRTLLLYAGRFDVTAAPTETFINGKADQNTVARFTDAIGGIGQYYHDLLDIPYGDHPFLLSFESVSRNYPNGRVGWQFVTWPTITFSGGLSFDQLIDTTGGTPHLVEWLWGSLAHEMGHYYFGTLRMPHGPLYWLELESTAEFLALKSTQKIRGDAALADRMINYLAAIAGAGALPPLRGVTDQEQITPAFRYQVLPSDLLLIDREVGGEKIARLLRALVQNPPEQVADYPALLRAASEAGITAEQLDRGLSRSGEALRTAILSFARTVLTAQGRTDGSALTNQLAIDLFNADTTVDTQRDVIAALHAITIREPANLTALYQLGRDGAISGLSLDLAQTALETYLRNPPPPAGPSHADANYRLGMVLEQRGKRADAVVAYRRALALNPQHSGAAAALNRLGMKP